MLSDWRQNNGVARLASVAMLFLATSILLGFSSPEESARITQGDTSTEPDGSSSQPSAVARADREVESQWTLIQRASQPASRPSSFVPASVVTENAILGPISSRLWLDPSVYSPDRAVAALHTTSVGDFHGVGYPDIRAYRKKTRRHNPLDPQPWAPMISWRSIEGPQSFAEPIAHVHCMGLSPQAVAGRADRYNKLILDYAIQYEISASLIKAVITEESCFNNMALSPVGAQGLMQLMPRTASWLKVKDPHDPADNLKAGIRYLATLREQFETLELALAAYNAGPGNVRRYGGVPPFSETRAYVRKVQANYRRYAAATLAASR